MAALCPAGHESLTDDYCSVCGAPIKAAGQGQPGQDRPGAVAPGRSGAPARPAPGALAGQQVCPVCHSVAAADAFFCETCGYDFLTGALPRGLQDPAEPGITGASETGSQEANRAATVAEASAAVDPTASDQETHGAAGPWASEAEAGANSTGPGDEAIRVSESEAPIESDTSAESDAAAGSDTSAEPDRSAEPAKPVPNYFDLGETPSHEDLDNPLVVDDAPEASAPVRPQPAPSSSLELGEGDSGAGSDRSSALDLGSATSQRGDHSPGAPFVEGSGDGSSGASGPQDDRPSGSLLDLGDAGDDVPSPNSLRPFARAEQATRSPAGPAGGGASPQRPGIQTAGTRQPEGAGPSGREGSASAQASAMPTQHGPARWVAEIWIDPEWYRLQQAPEQLPSPGQPIIKGLRTPRVVIGRTSGGVHPDLDCVADTGVSRQQAALTTDGVRWFIEDLGSSNGTYVGRVDQPLPIDPITRRTELGHHDRIYVGSWTRIVVRPALVQEADF